VKGKFVKTTKEIFEPIHKSISTIYKVEEELNQSIDMITSVKLVQAYDRYGERVALWLFVRDILNDIRGHFGLGEIGKNENEVIALKERVNKVKAYIN
tara:strand:+ start:131 stop:424 length:294 start_codon:yes stop_codon:yes gene_type:complete